MTWPRRFSISMMFAGGYFWLSAVRWRVFQCDQHFKLRIMCKYKGKITGGNSPVPFPHDCCTIQAKLFFFYKPSGSVPGANVCWMRIKLIKKSGKFEKNNQLKYRGSIEAWVNLKYWAFCAGLTNSRQWPSYWPYKDLYYFRQLKLVATYGLSLSNSQITCLTGQRRLLLTQCL